MTVYLVAQLRFVDRPAYDRYQARFMDVLKQSEGRLLVADEKPKVLEGSWDREKLVIMSFPSETSAREVLASKAYEESPGTARRAPTHWPCWPMESQARGRPADVRQPTRGVASNHSPS